MGYNDYINRGESHMNMIEIITKKVEGKKLTRREIHYFIKGYVANEIPDYQASALTMAIVFQGMDSEETAILTDEMMHSGDVVDLSKIKGIKVDKHSTGGVGDKTSLVVLPMVAACGAKIAKLSGRGLGHTGGTVDKLESIPNFNIMLSNDRFVQAIDKVGMAVVSQSDNLVPADKKLYALRDVTATVNSIPLIASSIMSKKLATGSDAICLDVKYGSGAFCETTEKAIKLSEAMIEIGNQMGRDVKAVISNMDEPLGFAVGNILEVLEAIDTLKGKGPKDLLELSLHSGSILLVQSKLYKDLDKARKALEKSIESGSAFNKFVEFVKYQGGDESYILNPDKFPKAKYIVEVKTEKAGYIQKINAEGIGEAARKLGAGRAKKEDPIDYTAGVLLNKKVGDKVMGNELLATIHTNKEEVINEVIDDILECYEIGPDKTSKKPLIYRVLG